MMTRRAMLGAGAWLTVIAPPAGADEPTVIPLWPTTPPGGDGPEGSETVDAWGAVTHVVRPSLTIVRPERPNGSLVMVAAGGGYKRIEIAREAMSAARWLTARGITAAVLTYRLPREGWNAGPLAPLQDAQRALRLIRAGATGHPAPERIGVLGFSAGGHLMGLAATRSGFRSYPDVDANDRLSARPDAAALIYPVITLMPPYDNTSTRRALVGEHPTSAASAEWSVETHVRAHCPPMFLVEAEDDPIANPANIRLMTEACEAAGVPVETHLLPGGGHGFAMGRPDTPSAAWPGWYETWLRGRGLLGSAARPDPQ